MLFDSKKTNKIKHFSLQKLLLPYVSCAYNDKQMKTIDGTNVLACACKNKNNKAKVKKKKKNKNKREKQ